MLTIYKKVEKNLENPGGIIQIDNLEELDKPFLLCMSAQDNNDKSIYGIIREGAQAARVYTTQEMASGFKIDQLPIDFLGLRFKKDEVYNNNYEEIVDTFIYPFLVGNGARDVEEIKKYARRINLMTYCDGTVTYEKTEKRLEEKLRNNGFSQEDVDIILSQISLVAIGTMVNTSDLKATTTAFVDVNDSEISTSRTPAYKKMLQDKGRKCIYGTLKNKNNVLYVYDGTGNHQLKEYLLDERVVKPAFCSVLSHFLENSVESEKSDCLIEISSVDSLKMLKIYSDETRETKDLLRDLDSKLSYGNSPKYTPEEAKVRYELDISYRELQKAKEQLERTEREKK